jgi:hypothetical protein
VATNVTKLRSTNPNTTPLLIPPKSQEGLLKYFNSTVTFLNNNFNLRDQLLLRDLAYAREKDNTTASQRARTQNDAGNPKALQDITIPVVMPQVESALGYLGDIFCSGYPIFPVLSKRDLSPEALQMETLIGEHSTKFGWVPELLMTLRDGLKYNLMVMEPSWKTKKTWAITTDETSTMAASKATETYYEGNTLRRIDPYNAILDTRVTRPAEMHIKGEFAGYTELMNRIELKQLIIELGATSTMNAREAFECGSGQYSLASGTDSYYIPTVNKSTLLPTAQLTTTNWDAWAGLDTNKKDGIKYKDMYEISTLYCRIIPSEFGLAVANRGTPQIWKLVVVNRQVIIYAERQTNAHNYLGILVGQPIEDGLGWQTKSFAENATPMQDASTALFASGMESQRRKVYDRMLYDASRINKKDIDNVSPVARIPVKQSAYGQNLADAVHVVPYNDNGIAEVIALSSQISGEMADRVNGQNRVSQGQFQKGNKSRKEFDTVMGNSNSRNVLMSLFLEYRFFTPLKEIIKLNILQYQPPTTLYNRTTKDNVKIDPLAIRAAAIEFRLADGVLSVDKMINVDALTTVMQMTAANPAAAAEWDLMGALMYALQAQGASWLLDFHRSPEEKVAYLQNIQATNGATNPDGTPVQPNGGTPQP